MKIYDVKHIPEELLPLVGGKARGLYLLNKFGFTVPEAFIVMDLNAEEDYQKAADEYEKRGFKLVAVRSSATLEDGKEFSSAGQFATILNVEGRDNFIKALKECQASLTSETAKAYAKMFLKNEESKMTIVVQEMVDAEVAGVLFTKNPQDQQSILIEAVKGLGEALVSSKVSAEQYIVTNDNFDRGNKTLLTNYQVKNIANGAKLAESSFKMPMDLEWAINKKGELNWLQARPITVHNEITMNELDVTYDASKCVFTTYNIREVLPGAVTPLTLSTNIFALDYGVREILHRIGCTKHLDDLPPYSILSNYYNTMFFNLSNIYRLMHSCYLASKEALELSICGKPLPDMPDIDVPFDNVFKRVIHTFKFLKYSMGCKPALKGMDKIVAKMPTMFDYEKPAKDIYKQIIDNIHYLNEATFYHYWTSWYSGSQCNTLITIKAKEFESREKLQALMAGALTNIDGIESAQILICMKDLAAVLTKNNPNIVNYNVEQLAEYLKTLSGEDKKALERFMMRHGHRCIKEFGFVSKGWEDDLIGFANSFIPVLSHFNDQKNALDKTWEDYADEIIGENGKIGKKALKSFIVKARKGVYSREYTKSRCIYVANYFKKAFRKIGELLVKDGTLPDADLINFLTKEEIGDLLDGKNSLMKVAIARRRLYKEQSQLKFEDVFIGKPTPLKPIEVDESISEYEGTPVSRGVVTGYAHIVRSFADANKLKSGEIMIAEITDIGWSPYYCTIAGLVTEIGSSLSHGVVVAREYSLPTVVNVNGALSVIKDGDYIRVDGNEGKVTILKR